MSDPGEMMRDGDIDPALDLATGVDAEPDALVAESLGAALKALREDADRIAGRSVDDSVIAEAEGLAERAAELDEEIGKAARRDEDRS